MRTGHEATSSDRPSSQAPLPPPLPQQVLEVGAVVARADRDPWMDVVYSVTLPSGFVATSPGAFRDEVSVPPRAALDAARRLATNSD